MEHARLILIFCLIAWSALSLHAETDSGTSLPERAARILSPEFREIKSRLAEIDEELSHLPQLREKPFALRYGYRSRTVQDQHDPQWVQIDLGRSEVIDRIVTVPVNAPVIGKRGAGYGFPLRFKVEVADNAEMRDSVIVVDKTEEDIENPGRYPVNFRLEGVKGRYVRFTSTKHFQIEEGFIWALEELIVLSGNLNLATFRGIRHSSSLEQFPNWSRERIADGHSALEMPVTLEKSPSRGYQSQIVADSSTKQWLVVDLGKELTLDEIRLLPVRSDHFQQVSPRSFPRAHKVELATDAAFETVTWSGQRERHNIVGFPGECAVIWKTEGKRGRYIRLEASDLWGQVDKFSFALSELQAYSGNDNVALGKKVSVSSAVGEPHSDEWFPAALVDGFTSRYRIIELPDYLDLIERRGNLEKEAGMLIGQKDRKVRLTGQILSYGSGSMALLLAFGGLWAMLRQRTLRKRAANQLRQQIARDLHDDIGSNLGGIVLLSEVGISQSEDPSSQADFKLIKNAADEASQSMGDIVWLIEDGNASLREQVARMRQCLQMILGDKEVSLSVEPAEFRDLPLSLLFRRHVLFSFKEALNNIRKHADAHKINVSIYIDSDHFEFIVYDNGKGFPCGTSGISGHGLGNIKKRAERLNGSCQIESELGKGTTITFTAPVKS